MTSGGFKNPYRPGAGHTPPYLAGRNDERTEFVRLLDQDTIIENFVLTGLRGVGKTVLLETFKPVAIQAGWLWVGTDLSESSSVSEQSIALRLLTDLSVVTSSIVVGTEEQMRLGFSGASNVVDHTLDYQALIALYEQIPGLAADKLKQVLEIVWAHLSSHGKRGIIFAYDEAQNLSDHAMKEQYPLSLLLDVFQSIQRKDVPFMLLLTGLPTLFPKLVEARTYAERMFRVVFLDSLAEEESRQAIVKPTEEPDCPVSFQVPSIELITETSGGYPYFLQFVCREAYDLLVQKLDAGEDPVVPIKGILRKLDTDFFAGRWARVTDRQRELLTVVAKLGHHDSEFTVQEIVEKSKELLDKPFSNSHVNQMLSSLSESGLVYKNRHGRYLFAVPLLGEFILRQE